MQRRSSFASYFAELLIAASIVSSPALAQGSPIGKGSWIISGSAGASSQHTDGNDQTVTTISLAPSALYFVSSGLAIGGSASVGYFNSSSNSSKSFGIGPSIRYYFGDQAAKTFPFVSATVAPTWTSTDPKNSSISSTSGHNTLVEGMVGLTHLLVPHVGITGEAYYDHLSLDADVGPVNASQNSYSIGVRFGLTAFVY